MANEYATPHFTNLPSASAVVDGGAAGDITVSGIEAQDELVGVFHLSVTSNFTDTISLGSADLTSEFSVSADDTINNTGGTSSASGLLLVIWKKVHPNGL